MMNLLLILMILLAFLLITETVWRMIRDYKMRKNLRKQEQKVKKQIEELLKDIEEKEKAEKEEVETL